MSAGHDDGRSADRRPAGRGERQEVHLADRRRARSDRNRRRRRRATPRALGQLLGSIRETNCIVAHDLGSPGRMLIERAESSGAGTIVVGSPHHGRIGRALLGGVAEHLLDHAPCEVVVAPHGYADEGHTGLAKIAVAVDGTPESKVALSRAEDLARQAGATIEILVASDPVVADIEAEYPRRRAGLDLGRPRGGGRLGRPGPGPDRQERRLRLAPGRARDRRGDRRGLRPRRRPARRRLAQPDRAHAARLDHQAADRRGPVPGPRRPRLEAGLTCTSESWSATWTASRGARALALGRIFARADGAEMTVVTAPDEDGENLAQLALSHRGRPRRRRLLPPRPAGAADPGGDRRAPARRSAVRGGGRPSPLRRARPRRRWLAAAQRRGEDIGMRVIGVGYDGSDAALEALRSAADLALANGATLRVYTVARKYAHVPGAPAATSAAPASRPKPRSCAASSRTPSTTCPPRPAPCRSSSAASPPTSWSPPPSWGSTCSSSAPGAAARCAASSTTASPARSCSGPTARF